ncbi:MAG: DUF4160 domain-containing protein [Spirochaetales bacterium]|nr:DUF4160 domain-containing protein [Spirochaetales bacterium]MCF7938408.1 DUF4160 domain-containing protein [Spirochaetales bacterium]
MPSVKGISVPYRFFFFSFDCEEPRHIHVQHENKVCKFWLEPILLSTNHRFSPHELNKIRNLIRKNENQILEAWREHCE